jgi:membrane protease YdiL (CAAX protease family)
MLRSMTCRLARFISTMKTDQHSSQLSSTTYLTFAAIMIAWIAAWMAKVHLDNNVSWLATSAGGFVYWTSAKLLFWVLPAYWLIRRGGRNLKLVFNVNNARSWLLWGGGIGLLIALTGWIPKWLIGEPVFHFQPSFALLNVLLIAPLFEEFLLRGAVLGNLRQQHSFWPANLVTSVCFLILHLPGWFFTRALIENLTKPIGGALSIFLVSLLFGYAVKRSNSLLAAVLAHLLNNLA